MSNEVANLVLLRFNLSENVSEEVAYLSPTRVLFTNVSCAVAYLFGKHGLEDIHVVADLFKQNIGIGITACKLLGGKTLNCE